MEITTIAIEKLTPSPTQPADRIKDVADLTKSIGVVGILNALTVRAVKGRFEVIAGHRRLAAAKALELKEVPCVVLPVDADQAQIIQITENVHRVPLTPMQEAASIRKLLDLGWDYARIGAELAMTPQYLARRARLLNLSPAWLKALNSPKRFHGDHWSTQALELIARYPHGQQDTLLVEFENYVPDMEELQGAIAEIERELKLAAWDLNDESLLPAAGGCSACPKRSGCEPLLFDELAEDNKTKVGDRCLDPQCWSKKLAAHLKRTEAKVLKEHPKIDRVSTQSLAWQLRRERGNEGVIGKDAYRMAKQTDKGAVPAMPIDGDKAGSVIWITKNRSGEVTRTRSKASGDKKPITDKERLERLINRRNMHVIEALRAHVENGKTKPDGLLSVPPHDKVLWAVCAITQFGYDPMVTMGNWTNVEKTRKIPIPDLMSQFWKCFKFQVRSFLFVANGEQATEKMTQIPDLVKFLGVDLAELQRKAAEEIPDRHGLLESRKSGRKNAPKGEDKTPSGTCSECGCTEDNACCKDGLVCSWANKEKTLCTFCRDKRKKAAANKSKANGKASPEKIPSFLRPQQPSAELAAIVGTGPMPRTELTKRLWDYIKKNGLQDKVNRRMINADNKLLALFGGKNQVSMFDLTKLVQKHCQPVKGKKHGK